MAHYGAHGIGRTQPVRRSLHILEKQGRPIRLHHTVCDLGDLQSGRHRLADPFQFALRFKYIEEMLEIAVRHPGRVY
jgi:hypothetical protein